MKQNKGSKAEVLVQSLLSERKLAADRCMRMDCSRHAQLRRCKARKRNETNERTAEKEN